jgi:hypothetical protein
LILREGVDIGEGSIHGIESVENVSSNSEHNGFGC